MDKDVVYVCVCVCVWWNTTQPIKWNNAICRNMDTTREYYVKNSLWPFWNFQMSSSRERVQNEENERVSKRLFLFYHCKNKDILLYPWPIRSLKFGMHDCGFQLSFNSKLSEKWSRNCWTLNIIFQISSRFLALK